VGTIIDGTGLSKDIIVMMSTGTTIRGFTIRNSMPAKSGILIIGSNNVIQDNIITNNNKSGIYLLSAFSSVRSNIISNNTITNNTIGIKLEGSNTLSNMIYHNTFTMNRLNAYDVGGNNQWYKSILQQGNYWDDYTGSDSNNDGVGDSPYIISGKIPASQDLYPLMEPWVNQMEPVVCGDANGDGAVDISDAVYLIAYIFSGGPAPQPLCSGDATGDGFVDISDAVYLIAYIFSGGPAPVSNCCE
jgi:parallel beta-helix repeat protein